MRAATVMLLAATHALATGAGPLPPDPRPPEPKPKPETPPRKHLYMHEYIDRPMLDLGPVVELPPKRERFYRCPGEGCGATASTPKRCRGCNLKMRRVFEVRS